MSNNEPVQTSSAGADRPGPSSDRVRVRRGADRANYDRDAVHGVFDASTIGHVGLVREGRPAIIPMFVVRDGNDLLVHGAPAAGVLRAGAASTPACIEATVLDGLVLARSAFHHSMNYRSAVAYGELREVTDVDEKFAALDLFTERLIPGRAGELRATTRKEVRGTSVLRMTIEEASAKARTGPPVDDDEDYELDIWAGVIPLQLVPGEPVADPRLSPTTGFPASIARALSSTEVTW